MKRLANTDMHTMYVVDELDLDPLDADTVEV